MMQANWRGWLQLSALGALAMVRTHPLRTLIQTVSLALGLALGLAVHLIHESALSAFSAGVRQFSGTADRVVRGPKTGFDLAIVDDLLRNPTLANVSPVVELDVGLIQSKKPVKWLGIDFMRAAAVTPQLLGQAQQADDFMADDSVFLSPALLAELQVKVGDSITTLVANETRNWRVAGSLPQSGAQQRLAVSDIAAAQWHFGLGDLVHRVDLQAAEGISDNALDSELRAHVTPPLWLDKPDEAGSRGAAVSRAYRVNLSILALVALLTGGFLIFSTQALAVVQRRRQWALLNALGAPTGLILSQILTESLLSGLIGSLLGIALGVGGAHAVLQTVGTDLGAGLLQGASQALVVGAGDILPFLLLGLLCSGLGALFPALEASRTPAVQALKSGSEDQALGTVKRPVWGLTCLMFSPMCLLLPPLHGLPVGAYAAIGLGLTGGIACMPALLQTMTKPPAFPQHFSDLAALKLAHSPGQTGIALAGIVASFSLVVAMAIMVDSFRYSLQVWLDRVLPAPLYMRVVAGDTVSLTPETRQALSKATGVDRAEFWLSVPVTLDADRPPPALVARPVNRADIAQTLPLTEPAIPAAPDGQIPVWVTEPMVSLYGWKPGSTQRLLLSGMKDAKLHVAGVWRDYARQQGAIVIDLEDYQALTGDLRTTDAAFWPRTDHTVGELTDRLRQTLDSQPWKDKVEFVQADFIRNISLQIFDRSFAITYVLEAAAIVIGLLGIASTFAATALARRREFAALLAMGAQTRGIMALLLRESLRVATIGAVTGLVLGSVFATILVKIVNPQSFHWSMDMHWPLGLLAILSSVLIISATLTGGITAWLALRQAPLHLLKEDTA